MALLEPFIDTVIICTMTALVIIITGMHLNTEGYGGIELTSKAFAKGYFLVSLHSCYICNTICFFYHDIMVLLWSKVLDIFIW